MTAKAGLIIFLIMVFIRLFQIYYYIFFEPMMIRKNNRKKDKNKEE